MRLTERTKEILTRRALRRHRRQALAAGDPDSAALLTQALNDPDILFLVGQHVQENSSPIDIFLAGGIKGGIAEFFQWFIDHKEEIIEFIKTLISLFAETDE